MLFGEGLLIQAFPFFFAGFDIRYIQELLGHSASKTTEIFTHVANKLTLAMIAKKETHNS